MVLFTRCCYCVRLNTGGLILGWLGIVTSLCILYKAMDEFYFFNTYNEFRFNSDAGQVFYVITFTVIAIYLIACVGLLNGCRDLNHYLLLPWMICEIGAMIYGMSLSLQSLMFLYSGETYYTDEKLAINILNILLVFLRVYWWLCVQSYYQLLKIQRAQRNAVEFPEAVTLESEKLCEEKKLGPVFII